MGRVRHPCPVVLVVWLVFVGGLGGIATIGAALRRVVGVSGVYGRKTPRVVAQSAVHLGGMRVEWGVWGVVDYGLGAVVGLMGEWWPVCAQAGPLGGGADGVPGLPLVGLTCAVEGLVLPPDTPRRPSAVPRPPGPVWASDRSGAPTTHTTPSVPRTPSGSGCLWEHSRAPSVCVSKPDRGRKGPVSGLGRRGWASDAA